MLMGALFCQFRRRQASAESHPRAALWAAGWGRGGAEVGNWAGLVSGST
jgi:hypothetical protein